MKILIIENEINLLSSIKDFLVSESFTCETAATFRDAEDLIASHCYDIILLDLSLPDGDGIDLIKMIKKSSSQTGILILSAKNSIDDKILGLDRGADDYIPKPFHLSELNSRIKALMRRRHFNGTNQLSFNEITINTDSLEVSVFGKLIDTTRKEYDILLFLIINRNRVITRESLAEHVWGDNIEFADNFDFLYSHIKNLRKKIEQNGGTNYIRNIYGIGYKFSE